jgi:peptidyl-prolyl cis-trans isomerase A (cyclophilin A)
MAIRFLASFSACALMTASLWGQAQSQPATAAAPGTAPPPREPGLYATVVTNLGTVVFKFYETESPITTRNFIDLTLGRKAWKDPKTGQTVRRPLLPGTTFHRVIPGFMIQGGDPTGTGAGDVGFVIPDEFHPSLKFDKPGKVAMANAGPKTGSSQFFITEVPTPHLTGMHTIFGQVVEGQEVVEKIARAPRDGNDKPRTAVIMSRITFKREGPAPPNAPEGAARPATTTKKAAPATKSATPAKSATPTKSAAPVTKKGATPAKK